MSRLGNAPACPADATIRFTTWDRSRTPRSGRRRSSHARVPHGTPDPDGGCNDRLRTAAAGAYAAAHTPARVRRIPDGGMSADRGGCCSLFAEPGFDAGV